MITQDTPLFFNPLFVVVFASFAFHFCKLVFESGCFDLPVITNSYITRRFFKNAFPAIGWLLFASILLHLFHNCIFVYLSQYNSNFLTSVLQASSILIIVLICLVCLLGGIAFAMFPYILKSRDKVLPQPPPDQLEE